MAKTTTKRNYNKLKEELGPKYKTTSIHSYQYWAKVIKVVDGDTIDFEIDLGFDITTFKRTRLIGVDTPEVWGVKRTTKEYKEGKKASDYVKGLLHRGTWVELKVYKDKQRGKYGRWLCEVFVDGMNLNEHLIKKGYVGEYGK